MTRCTGFKKKKKKKKKIPIEFGGTKGHIKKRDTNLLAEGCKTGSY